MKKYSGYLLDLDGTMYAGTEVIEGAREFIAYLANNNLPYLFVTNNASKRPDEVADKLSKMGFVAHADNVVTSAMATASYIADEKPGATVYVIGGTGIRQALEDEGLEIKEDEHVDYVVIGLDVDINYEKLSIACLAVRNGAKFISTNPDTSIPTERGFLPGNGALTSVITVSTGVEPKFIGKPMPTIMNKAVEMIGLDKSELVMIGDLYMTDIMSGINSDIDTLHVQTGVSTYEQVMAEAVPPTYSVKNLLEVIDMYEGNNMKVLITRSIPKHYVEQLESVAEVEVYPETIKPMPREALLESSKDKSIVISMLSDTIDKEFIDNNPDLKAVINLAVGYDNIDIDYARSKDITVCNTPDVLTETTAELAFTLMFVTARRIIEANELVKEGNWVGWSPYLLAGLDVYKKTVGIFGMGNIGTALAKRCIGLNMHVQYHNRSESEAAKALGANYVSFNELLETSDFIICTAPLTNETKNIFNKDAFKKMKSSVIFINIGRGGHVVENDLLEAIQNEEIYAAGGDVLNNEPVGKEHPFLSEKRITVLPHIGSATVDTRNAMIELCIKNAELIIEGKKPVSEVKNN